MSIVATHRAQPLEAIQLPDALLRLDTLAAASGLSIATLYRKAAAGELALVKIGTRCTRVRSADARSFIQSQGVQR